MISLAATSASAARWREPQRGEPLAVEYRPAWFSATAVRTWRSAPERCVQMVFASSLVAARAVASVANQASSSAAAWGGVTAQSSCAQQHGPLRVACGGVEQGAEGSPDAFACGGESPGDELTEVQCRKRGQRNRSGLGVEGAALVGEERLHHPDLAAGEDVAGSRAVMLNLRADDGVGGCCGEHILELVEGAEHSAPVTLVEPKRQVQAFSERVARSRRRRYLQRDRAAAHACDRAQCPT